MLVVDIPAAGHDDRCPDDADVTGAVFRASRHPQLLGGGAELVRAANERENILRPYNDYSLSKFVQPVQREPKAPA